MSKKKELKKVPLFKDENEEAEFWRANDSTEYVDWSKARYVVFPNLKPTTRTISLRLPAMLLEDIRRLANKRDVPYQSLMKMLLSGAVQREMKESQ